MTPISGDLSARKQTCYGGHWLYVLMGVVGGFAAAGLWIVLNTDVDTPVFNEPKCETIIIHRR